MYTIRFLAVTAATLLASCASLPSGSAGADRGSGARGTNVTVLDAEQLGASRGTLLSMMTGRVAQLRVFGGEACPRLEIRGRTSLMGRSDPSIYLDGTQAANTCLLEQVSVTDLQRVEVYPMGVTSRPGYRSSAGGLILLFSRRTAP